MSCVYAAASLSNNESDDDCDERPADNPKFDHTTTCYSNSSHYKSLNCVTVSTFINK